MSMTYRTGKSLLKNDSVRVRTTYDGTASYSIIIYINIQYAASDI